MVRLLSGVVLAAVTLAAVLFLPFAALRVVVCIVAAVAAHEYLTIVGTDSRALLLVVAVCWLSSGGRLPAAEYLLLPALAWVAADVLFSTHTVQQAAVGVFAAIYIGLPLGLLAAMHGRGGATVTLLLIATVVVSDSLQYYTGRMLGRRPLAPTISPKKTIEGALGGVLAGTLFMAAAGHYVFPAVPIGQLAVTGLLIVVFGICGDLFESRLKRVAGVKDSASLIPGHGGVLDRIDALLFAAPVFFVFLAVGPA